MTASPTAPSTSLKPSYTLATVLIIGGLAGALLALLTWGPVPAGLAGSVLVFGLFLLYQTTTLRLLFTATDLDIYRGATRIRRFPYREWEVWDIFWQPVPILFYFREVNSIHFLPILFNPQELRSQLEQHVPHKAEQ
ncbi:MAG: DUF3119 family protein [Leptolyngbyaceae cyanobacterium]